MATSTIKASYYDKSNDVQDLGVLASVSSINHIVNGNMGFLKFNFTAPSTSPAEYTEVLKGIQPPKTETAAVLIPNESLGSVSSMPVMYLKTSGALATRTQLPSNKHFWVTLSYEIA